MERLREIEKSLAPPPAPVNTPPPFQKPESAASDLTEALLKVPEMLVKLDSLLEEHKTVADALVSMQELDFSLRQLSVKVESHLSELRKLSDGVDRRVKALDLAEAKYKRLIENVDAVLPALEKELNR